MLQLSLHPSRTVLSVDTAPLERRVLSLPVVVHLNSGLRSKEAAAEVAALSPLLAVVCDSSTDSKVVLPMLRGALEKAASVMVKVGDGEGSAGGKRKKGRDYSTPPSIYRQQPPPSS